MRPDTSHQIVDTLSDNILSFFLISHSHYLLLHHHTSGSDHTVSLVLDFGLGLLYGHLIIYVFDPIDILGVFGHQFLLCLTGSIAS
jgi:hypothetical protein